MIPEGYEKLAAIGIAYKGVYKEGSTYGALNAVYYGGSTYVSLRDNPAGPPTDDNVNWQYLAKGFVEGLLEAIDAVDTSGLMGIAGATVDAQNLLDVIADKVATKLIPYANLVNNGLCTEAGKFPLDAAYGKNLQDSVDILNRDLIKVAIQSQKLNVPADSVTAFEYDLSAYGNVIATTIGIIAAETGNSYLTSVTTPEKNKIRITSSKTGLVTAQLIIFYK